jgi:SAM-dependent methyltransferase
VSDGYDDPVQAEVYDRLFTWAPCDDFYVGLVLDAGAVLDVGCGTGLLLHGARDRGHTGRLVGVDPAKAMLDRARRRTDVEWVHGDMRTARWDGEFDLAVMTGHAFQELVTDDDIRTTLAGVRTALRPGGRFAFETRNPAARPWERWTPERVFTAGDTRVFDQVETVADGIVTFTETTEDPALAEPAVTRGRLRFLGRDELARVLAEAGFTIERQLGDWTGGPVTDTSPEIITVAVSPAVSTVDSRWTAPGGVAAPRPVR